VLALLDDYGSPATVASAGGRYFGFVTGGAMPVTVAAQYLAAAWDQNCFSFVSSPAVACIESTALRWVKAVLGLPATAEGALVNRSHDGQLYMLGSCTEFDSAGIWVGDVDRHGLFAPRHLLLCSAKKPTPRSIRFYRCWGWDATRILCVPSRWPGMYSP